MRPPFDVRWATTSSRILLHLPKRLIRPHLSCFRSSYALRFTDGSYKDSDVLRSILEHTGYEILRTGMWRLFGLHIYTPTIFTFPPRVVHSVYGVYDAYCLVYLVHVGSTVTIYSAHNSSTSTVTIVLILIVTSYNTSTILYQILLDARVTST